MRSMFFVWTVAASLFMLTACSSYAPPADLSGVTRDQLIARMGRPEMQRPLDGGGTRLEFPGGTYGKQSWFVDLDASGCGSPFAGPRAAGS